jgi:head-tail adaptor
MNAGKLDKRVLIKRQTKTSDGFGGYTSNNATQSTIWANVSFTKGDITNKNGRKKRSLQIELLIRKKTADNILTTDLLQIENIAGLYQINDMYDANYKYYTKLIATKRD